MYGVYIFISYQRSKSPTHTVPATAGVCIPEHQHRNERTYQAGCIQYGDLMDFNGNSGDLLRYMMVSSGVFEIVIEHGTFLVDLPIRNCDFP